MITVQRYGYFDGIPSFKDSDIRHLYDRMDKDGTAETVFSDGAVRDSFDFLALMKDPGTVLAIAFIENMPVGIGWLTNIAIKRANGHFCLFSNGWGKNSAEIGKALVEHLIGLNVDGEHLFDVLIGYTPSSNIAAIEFSLKCGGVIVGQIPGALYCARTKESEPATVIYYQRR